MLEHYNYAIFLALNATSETTPLFLWIALFVARDLILLIPLILLAFWFSGKTSLRGLALQTLCVVSLTIGINCLIGKLYPLSRPFVLGLGHTFLQHAPTPSFPSSHGAIFVSAALTILWEYRRKWVGVAMLVLAIFVCWSRIFVGVHFPLDMLGAWIVAGFSLIIVCPIWGILGLPLTMLTEKIYRKIFSYPISKGWLRP